MKAEKPALAPVLTWDASAKGSDLIGYATIAALEYILMVNPVERFSFLSIIYLFERHRKTLPSIGLLLK